MAVPRRPKPQAADEAARVLRIYDWLDAELAHRQPTMIVTDGAGTVPQMVRVEDIRPLPVKVDGGSILAVAECIAARTEG
jgi:hypothetical protein